jgi:hypothetical protein
MGGNRKMKQQLLVFPTSGRARARVSVYVRLCVCARAHLSLSLSVSLSLSLSLSLCNQAPENGKLCDWARQTA